MNNAFLIGILKISSISKKKPVPKIEIFLNFSSILHILFSQKLYSAFISSKFEYFIISEECFTLICPKRFSLYI